MPWLKAGRPYRKFRNSPVITGKSHFKAEVLSTELPKDKYDLYDLVRAANDLNSCPSKSWTSWFYQHLVPKNKLLNMEWRKKMLRMIYENDNAMEEIQCICARDILFEINTFGWTYAVKDSAKHPVVPFITFAFQDAALLEIQSSLGREDIAMPKSRDLGASWMCLLAMEHRWRYEREQSFLLASRKLEYVNSPRDKKGLMQKLVWYTQHLPHCLQPRKWVFSEKKESPYILNKDNGSLFSTEATVANLGTGDRRTAIFLDEVSKMPNADFIFTSTRDATNCRIFNGTPYGRFGIGKPFYDQVADDITKKIWLHWTDHPDKAKGLYYLNERGQRTAFEDGWHWSSEYDFLNFTFTGREARSEWYDAQCKRETGDNRERRIAQELDLNFTKAGRSLFDDATVAKWMHKASLQEVCTWGKMAVDPEACTVRWVKATGNLGPDRHPDDMVLWIDLIHDERSATYRIPSSDYVLGADVAAGTKGKTTSSSALVIIDRRKKKMVARFATRDMRPPEFARLCVAVCKWFHNALLVVEVNGPTGTTFVDTIANDNLYHNLYYRKVKEIGYNSWTDKVGYWNNDKGLQLLLNLEEAVGNGKLIITDPMVFQEMGQYQYDNTGGIYHTGSKNRDATGNEGRAHGDCAIAAGCAWEGIRAEAYAPAEEKKTDRSQQLERQPHSCLANRMLDHERRQRSKYDPLRS